MKEWNNNFCHKIYIFLGEDEGGPVRTLVFRRSHCNSIRSVWKFSDDHTAIRSVKMWKSRKIKIWKSRKVRMWPFESSLHHGIKVPLELSGGISSVMLLSIICKGCCKIGTGDRFAFLEVELEPNIWQHFVETLLIIMK